MRAECAGHEVSPAPAPPAFPSAAVDPAALGVLGLFSPKGGVGTSFLAGRISSAAASAGVRTALLDLDLTTADAGPLLDLECLRSLFELIPLLDELSAEDVRTIAAEHASGLLLLATTPFGEGHAQLLDPGALSRLVGALRAHHELVVLDIPAGLDERTVAALWSADRVLIVATPEVPCVRAVRQLLELLARHGFPMERLGLLHNMDDPASGARATDVAAALGVPLVGQVPFLPAQLRRIVNGGRSPRDTADAATLAISDLTGRLLGLRPAAIGRPRRWGRP